MTIRTRQAGITDIDIVAPLFDAYRQFYGQAPNLPLAQEFIRNRMALLESVILLAENAHGQASGFTQLYPSFSSVSAQRVWILNDLFVADTARGQGVGAALLHAGKAFAQACGAKRLLLSTAHDNPAQKLYEAHCYVRDEQFFHYSLELK